MHIPILGEIVGDVVFLDMERYQRLGRRPGKLYDRPRFKGRKQTKEAIARRTASLLRNWHRQKGDQ